MRVACLLFVALLAVPGRLPAQRLVPGRFAPAPIPGANAAPEAFAMGVLTGTERERRAGLLKSARRGGKRLKQARVYWN